MSDETILKEFLVALGFKVDESSFKKFGEGVGGATKAVVGLGLGVAATAVATETFVTRMAASLDRLYFATQRTGASASDIGDFQLAIQKLGGSADGALSSLEAVARFRRTTPGADGLLESWGVSAKDIGNAEKTLEDLAVHFRQIPEALAYKEGGILGIDEKTLLAMLNPDFHVGNDVGDLYNKLGINQAQALEGAHSFENQLRTMGAEFSAYGTWMETELIGPFGKLNEGILHAMSSFKDFLAIKDPGQRTQAVHDGIEGRATGVWNWAKRVLGGGNAALNAGLGSAAENAGLPDWAIHGFGLKTTTDIANPAVKDYAGQATKDARTRQALAFFQSKGWSANEAAGIVANLNAESGLFGAAVGDGGHAKGIAQWHEDRQANFMKRYHHGLDTATQEEQLDFVNYELTEGSERAAGAKLRGSSSAALAGFNVSKYYERPMGGDISAAGRGLSADRLSRDVSVNAPVTITVTGSVDPHATAQAVTGAQKGATEHLVGEMSRNFGGNQ